MKTLNNNEVMIDHEEKCFIVRLKKRIVISVISFDRLVFSLS